MSIFDNLETDEEAIERKVRDLRLSEEARKLHRAGSFNPPTTIALNIDELSALPKTVTPWRIEGLHRKGSSTILIAVRKAGKSTMMVNLIRSLVDGLPFLGEHNVMKLDGTFLWCDFEQGQDLGREMIEAVGIGNPRRALHWDLKGQRFNIMNDALVEWFIGELKRLEVQAFAFDTFRKAFKGKSANDDQEVAEFQDRIDRIKEESGVDDFFMPVHAGWVAGTDDKSDIRARGASGLEDWPDALWTLATKEKVRYFKAKHVRGMDDNALSDERALNYDHMTRTLTYDIAKSGVTRATTANAKIRDEVKAFIYANPGCTQRDLRANVGGTKETVIKEAENLAALGDVEIELGPKSGPHPTKKYWPKGGLPPGAIPLTAI